jgi:PAS domain S-box-containing protein
VNENEDEERLLREVTLQSATSIFLARQRAEEELVRTKEALELKAQELAYSLAMMRATLESTTDGILVTDGGGRVTDFNRRYADMWRLPPEIVDSPEHQQLLEVSSRQLGDSPSFLARVEEIYAASPPESYDLLELADGRVFERFSRVQHIESRTVGRVWSFRDITERKRAEEALRKQAEWWRVTVSSVGDAVITTDIEGRVTSLNPVAESLTGWSQQEAQGVPLERVFCIVNQESRQPVESPVTQSLREGRIVGLANHTILIARDGPERAIDDSAAPIRDEQGQIIGVVLIFRDVTRERQAQQTTEFLADASTALAELTDSESTLQKIAALAVPFFADWCAVDMRETGGTVRRLAVTHTHPARAQLAHELFRRYPPRPDDPHGTMKVLRTGEPEWVAAIPDSLLEESAADEEHLRMLRALGLKSFLCVPLKSRGQTLGALTFVTAESGRVYDADGLRAAEDLAHRAVIAIENAALLEALRESDRRKDEFLAILAHELRNPLAPVRNAVQILRAKSPPIPELQWAHGVIDRQVEQMTRLVDDLLDVSRITQVERSLERAQGGLGIGLTLVHRLVAMHGGAVEAQSPGPGRGSEFVVRLPIAGEARASGAERAAVEDERMAAAAGCRILVVDDNRDAADSLGMLLQMIGHEVRIAGDGLEAVGVAEAFEPDVILLDIGLPKLNGYQVAGRIREQRGGDVVLIALTGWGQEEDRRRSTEAGFDHHLTKPVEFDALSKLLADINPDPG